MKTVILSFVMLLVWASAFSHNSQAEAPTPQSYKWVQYCQDHNIDPVHATMAEVYGYTDNFDGVYALDILMGNGGLDWVVYCNQYDVDPDNATEEQENYFLDVWIEGEIDMCLEK